MIEMSMEARQEQEDYDIQQTAAQKAAPPLSVEYKEIKPLQVHAKKQRREISFFGHLAVYSVLMGLILSLSMAEFPIIVAIPVGLTLPLGIIIGCKALWNKYK
jgi:hypothetical protein